MADKRSPYQLPSATPPEKEIKALKEELRIANQKIYALSSRGGKYVIDPNGASSLKLGVTSDWHVGSLYCNERAIIDFHEYAYSQGVRHFVNAGDVIEGESNYKGQIYEIKQAGLTRQVAALEEIACKLPQGAEYIFITGNHCGGYHKEVGIDIGDYIEMKIPMLKYIGRDKGMIEISTPSGDVRVQLIHPDGGTAYAVSYKVQKIVEGLAGGDKPHLLVVGHYHKAELLPRIRNVAALQAGTFQEQTPFMARKGAEAHVGGWIVEFEMGELYNRIKTEFVSFF